MKTGMVWIAAAGLGLGAPAPSRAEEGRPWTLNAEAAVETLKGGTAAEATLETSWSSGFKAEEELQGLRPTSHPAVEAGSGGPALRAPGAGTGAPPNRPEPTAILAHPPEGPPRQAPVGLADSVRAKVGGWVQAARNGYARLGRAGRLALLGGFLAAEVATILYPYQAIAVVATGIAVLGIVGTTREVIAEIRRNRRAKP